MIATCNPPDWFAPDAPPDPEPAPKPPVICVLCHLRTAQVDEVCEECWKEIEQEEGNNNP